MKRILCLLARTKQSFVIAALGAAALGTPGPARAQEMPLLKATHSRVGNSVGGIVPDVTFPGGAPVRAKVATFISSVWLTPDGDLLIYSRNNEGGPHVVKLRWDAREKRWKAVWGRWDYPSFRPDLLTWVADDHLAPIYGSVPIPDLTDPARPVAEAAAAPADWKGAHNSKGRTWEEYFFPRGRPDTSGYSWRSLVPGANPPVYAIETPRGPLYSAMWTDNAVPIAGSFDLVNGTARFGIDRRYRGDGGEVRSVAPTVDLAAFPDDPRGVFPHRMSLRTWKAPDGRLFLASSNGSGIDVFRWEEGRKLWAPAAAFYFHGAEVLRSQNGDRPAWGAQKALAGRSWWRGGVWSDRRGDGLMRPGDWELLDTGEFGNGSSADVAPDGALWFLPDGHDAPGKAHRLLCLPPDGYDRDGGPVYTTRALRRVNLPPSLSACRVRHLRLDFATGDLYALVQLPGEPQDAPLSLVRYRDVLTKGAEAQRAWVRPAVASRMRRGVHPGGWQHYDWAGGVRACEGFVFLLEGQGGGVKVYRASDGAPVGRLWTADAPNSTIDDVGGFCAWRVEGEIWLTAMDFNGSCALLWRVRIDELRRAAEGNP